MNRQYQESEAVLLYEAANPLFSCPKCRHPTAGLLEESNRDADVRTAAVWTMARDGEVTTIPGVTIQPSAAMASVADAGRSVDRERQVELPSRGGSGATR